MTAPLPPLPVDSHATVFPASESAREMVKLVRLVRQSAWASARRMHRKAHSDPRDNTVHRYSTYRSERLYIWPAAEETRKDSNLILTVVDPSLRQVEPEPGTVHHFLIRLDLRMVKEARDSCEGVEHLKLRAFGTVYEILQGREHLKVPILEVATDVNLSIVADDRERVACASAKRRKQRTLFALAAIQRRGKRARSK